MPERQIIELPFFQGIDSKSDAKQIPLGRLLVLQNAVFTSPGKLQKRNGYTALTTNILGGGTISSGAALFTRSNELCMTDTSSNLYSYDQSNTAWVSKGKMPSVTASVSAAANPQYSTYAVDMAISGTLQCFVYELQDVNAGTFPGTKKGLGYAVVDSTTGQVVVPPSTLDATASSVQPHVVVLGTNFVCYYIQGDLAATAGIFGKTLSTTTPNAGWSVATQLTSGTTTSAQKIAAGAYQFDACVSGTNGYISFNNRSDGTTIFQTTSASPLAVNATKSVATTSSRASCVFPDVSGDIVLGFITASAATAAVFDSTLVTTKLAASVIENSLSNYCAITGTSTATNTVQFFVGNAASAQAQQIRTNTLTTASYTVGTASTLTRQLNIAAKAFTYNAAAYLPSWFCINSASIITRVQSPQNSLYLLDSSGNVLSKALVGTAGCLDTISATYTNFYQLGASTVSSGTVAFPATASNLLSMIASSPFVTSLFGSSTIINYQFGAAAVSFNFSDTTNNYLRGQLANAIHTSGGVLQMYDGANVVEHGFLIYPQGITTTTSGAGSITPGAHSWVVTYSWMDGQGQFHQSTPSAPVSLTISAGANDHVTLTIPTLRVTAKSGVRIDVWRTLANGTVYYQLSNFNNGGSLFNDKTVDTVSWVDSLADASISTNPQIYTTGNALQNAPCNPAGPMVVHRNRLFVVDSTNPTQVWYSKLVSPPAPVEFSGFQILNIDPKGGPVTALASLDDKMIIFKKDRIFMVLGQGPDSTGNQNDFTDAILVSSDTGCATPKSVVVVPDGIMFYSPKGIYLLNRALQVSYIGAPVEGLFPQSAGGNTNVVPAAILRPFNNQVLFFGNANAWAVGVYDYLVGQWSTFASAASIGPTADAAVSSSLSSNGPVFFLNGSTGAVYAEQQQQGGFTDAGTAITMTVTTGWIKLAGLQGFQRARKVAVLGEYKSNHTLSVAVAYDYQSAATQTYTFTVTGDANPYEYMIHLAQQKCKAVQFAISDTNQSGTDISFTLSGLALEVAMKRGLAKLPAAQRG